MHPTQEIELIEFLEHLLYKPNLWTIAIPMLKFQLYVSDITILFISCIEYGVELDIRHWMAKEESIVPMWFQLLVLVCSLFSSVVCFEVQGASAQEGMLIKLKPLISLSI